MDLRDLVWDYRHCYATDGTVYTTEITVALQKNNPDIAFVRTTGRWYSVAEVYALAAQQQQQPQLSAGANIAEKVTEPMVTMDLLRRYHNAPNIYSLPSRY